MWYNIVVDYVLANLFSLSLPFQISGHWTSLNPDIPFLCSDPHIMIFLPHIPLRKGKALLCTK